MQTGRSRGRARSRGVGALCALALCLLSAWLFAQEPADPARGLKSKVVAERLAAIEALRISPDTQNEKLLLGALADKDWEVSEKAALALADRGGDSSVAQLVRLCIDGPVLRMRRAGARTLAKIAPFKGTAELAKLTAGKSAARALEALAIVARASADGSAGGVIQRGLKSKDRSVRAAAAQCIAAMPQGLADDVLAELLKGGDAELIALALDAITASGDAHFITGLLKALHEAQVPDVLERRLIAASVASMGSLEKLGRPVQPAKQLEAFAQLGPLATPEAESRAIRLYAALARGLAVESPMAGVLSPLLVAGLSNKHPNVRKAAIVGVLRNATPGGREAVLGLAAKDSDASVRVIALCELVRALGAKDSALFAVLTESVANDPDAGVREEAAVSLGVPELPGAAIALGRALDDGNWAVVTCAAVSLGKTRDSAALAPLQALLSNADWRQRASATVGLCWLMNKDAVPALMRALGDADPCVRRTAFVFLEQQFKAHLPEERAAWEAWWKANEKRAQLVDPAAAKQRRERYGYAAQAAGVFEDLDVVVLDSRGDHIQRVLDQLKIAHRTTQASKLAEAALHPGAIYVSNCTGEIEPKDALRIAWYVRAGGVLFGSCWSLTETIDRVHPGILRHFETPSEVLDDVVARAVDPTNPYLKDVFKPDCEPMYHLEGSHLIEVLEPERCEVLIDSPQALARWGGGNLAAAFRSGHGLILDSANHFELQGLEVAPGVKTSEERIAFAFDHLGMDFETWRRTQNEKWWDNALKASQNVFDFSALQFVTNFVRAKRLADN